MNKFLAVLGIAGVAVGAAAVGYMTFVSGPTDEVPLHGSGPSVAIGECDCSALETELARKKAQRRELQQELEDIFEEGGFDEMDDDDVEAPGELANRDAQPSDESFDLSDDDDVETPGELANRDAQPSDENFDLSDDDDVEAPGELANRDAQPSDESFDLLDDDDVEAPGELANRDAQPSDESFDLLDDDDVEAPGELANRDAQPNDGGFDRLDDDDVEAPGELANRDAQPSDESFDLLDDDDVEAPGELANRDDQPSDESFDLLDDDDVEAPRASVHRRDNQRIQQLIEEISLLDEDIASFPSFIEACQRELSRKPQCHPSETLLVDPRENDDEDQVGVPEDSDFDPTDSVEESITDAEQTAQGIEDMAEDLEEIQRLKDLINEYAPVSEPVEAVCDCDGLRQGLELYQAEKDELREYVSELRRYPTYIENLQRNADYSLRAGPRDYYGADPSQAEHFLRLKEAREEAYEEFLEREPELMDRLAEINDLIRNLPGLIRECEERIAVDPACQDQNDEVVIPPSVQTGLVQVPVLEYFHAGSFDAIQFPYPELQFGQKQPGSYSVQGADGSYCVNDYYPGGAGVSTELVSVPWHGNGCGWNASSEKTVEMTAEDFQSWKDLLGIEP